MAKKQTRNQPELSAENVDGNVDKIREILFGGQMRDYEERFSDLEGRLTKNIELISSNFEKRMDRLDTFAKREIDKLAEQVKEERKARRDDGKQDSKEFKELAQQVESWCAELEEQIGTETQELRGVLQEQGEELSGMINDTHEQLSKSLATETRNLADGKLAREDMAALLTEVALRLKKDSKLPGA
jgi:archaellum component FlaC